MALVVTAQKLLLFVADPRHEQKVTVPRLYVKYREVGYDIRGMFQQKELAPAIALYVNGNG
jgi:hypothetical protein